MRSDPAQGDATSIPREQVSGVVLCGGRSTRMGRDKALLSVADGGTWLERALDLLEPVVHRGFVACGPRPRYARELAERPAWSLVLDELPDGGPLAGLAAALSRVEDGWLLALAVDMPGVGPAEVDHLLSTARADDDVVLFEDARGPQPLFALYHARCARLVADALAAGERRVVSFWSRPLGGRPLRVRRAPAADLPSAPAADVLRNVNTPMDWAAERARHAGA